MNAIDRLIRQKTVDDKYPRQFQSERLHTGRLEHKTSLVPKITNIPRLQESVDILARVRHVTDAVKGVRGPLDGCLVRLLVSKERKDLPLNLWKLFPENILTEIRSDIQW
jgi:hypothetical protein